MASTRARVTVALFAAAAVAALAAVGMTVATRGDGANIGAGMVILLAMLLALIGTVRMVQAQAARAHDPSSGLGRRVLTGIAGGAAPVAVLAAVVGQWPVAVAALIPAGICAFYAARERTA